jgi:hypothetical protein
VRSEGKVTFAAFVDRLDELLRERASAPISLSRGPGRAEWTCGAYRASLREAGGAVLVRIGLLEDTVSVRELREEASFDGAVRLADDIAILFSAPG